MSKSTKVGLAVLALIVIGGCCWFYWLFVLPEHRMRALLCGSTEFYLASMKLRSGDRCILITDAEVLDYLTVALRSSKYEGHGGWPAETGVRSSVGMLLLSPRGSWSGTVYVHRNGRGLTFAIGELHMGDLPSYTSRFSEPMPPSLTDAMSFLLGERKGILVIEAQKRSDDAVKPGAVGDNANP